MNELKAIPCFSGAEIHIKPDQIPAHVGMNLAQCLIDAINQEFQRPEVQEDYERWLEEYRARPKVRKQ